MINLPTQQGQALPRAILLEGWLPPRERGKQAGEDAEEGGLIDEEEHSSKSEKVYPKVGDLVEALRYRLFRNGVKLEQVRRRRL